MTFYKNYVKLKTKFTAKSGTKSASKTVDSNNSKLVTGEITSTHTDAVLFSKVYTYDTVSVTIAS